MYVNASTYIILVPHDGQESEQRQIVIRPRETAERAEHGPDDE